MLVIAILLGSILAHELGHVVIAYATGGKVVGVGHSKTWMALGIKVVPKSADDIWKIALAGPATNAALAGMFRLLYIVHPGVYAYMGFIINLAMALINLIPIRIADGGFIVRELKRRNK